MSESDYLTALVAAARDFNAAVESQSPSESGLDMQEALARQVIDHVTVVRGLVPPATLSSVHEALVDALSRLAEALQAFGSRNSDNLERLTMSTRATAHAWSDVCVAADAIGFPIPGNLRPPGTF